VIGAVLGPIAIPVAVDARRRAEPAGGTALATSVERGGPVDVLVGSDGSPESRAAARAATSLLGVRLGRLTLATVVPIDATRETLDAAVRDLEQEARTIDPNAGRQVLRGAPADALTRHAFDDDYELLAIGARGRGRARTLLGSVASNLARSARVPVLVVGDESPISPR
jgi:nucleotide-binding universal stress UspA family protein